MQRSDGFMDWVDRMREQATEMAERAQDAQKIGQSRWADLQERRRFDALLRDLGELIYAQETEGASPTRSRAIAATLASLKVLEADLDTVDLREPAEEPSPANID